MVRDRSFEEDDDAASPPDGRGRPGDCGVGNRRLAVVLAGVGSRRAVPPLAGRWTNASTLDSNIGAARRAATFLDRLALVMVARIPRPCFVLGSNDERIRSFDDPPS